MHAHTIHAHDHRHFAWDNTLPPVLRVAVGDTITFDCRDASDGQIVPGTPATVFDGYDSTRVNPVAGPVHVEGAKPGDTLVVELVSYRPSGWGWTAIIPGFGLLADQFGDARMHHWHYDPSGGEPMLYGHLAAVPLAPFAGTIGVAPAAAGPHAIIPPRRVGGNMDVKDLVAGSILYLPVEVEGALLSIGDTHAAQGDGEVCGTAIESPMEVVVRVSVTKADAPAFPRLFRPAAVNMAPPPRGHIAIATGIGPDLHLAARDAVAGMIDQLARDHGLAADDAYMLASVAGDLKISQVVDAPNWTVSFQMPYAIFDI